MCTINETQKQMADMGCEELLRRDASTLTEPTHARAQDEHGLAGDDWRHESRDEFRRIAAVAVEKQENVGVVADGGDASLDGATIAAPRLNDYTGARGFRPLSGAIARGTVDNDDFAYTLRQHRGDNRTDRRFFIEAWNDR